MRRAALGIVVAATTALMVGATTASAAPDAVDDRFGLLNSRPAELRFLSNDDPNATDDGPRAVAVVAQPAKGTVACAPDAPCIYTPLPGAVGMDAFTYALTDGVTSDTATVVIELFDPVPHPLNARPARCVGASPVTVRGVRCRDVQVVIHSPRAVGAVQIRAIGQAAKARTIGLRRGLNRISLGPRRVRLFGGVVVHLGATLGGPAPYDRRFAFADICKYRIPLTGNVEDQTASCVSGFIAGRPGRGK